MTRFMTSRLAVTALIASSAAMASPPQGGPANSAQPLLDGLHVVAAAQGLDPDQGDDHASARAIFVVCNHDNPSAQRSAICPTPNSPP
jgi:hypothetical protein